MLQSVFDVFRQQTNYLPCCEGDPYANAHKAGDFPASVRQQETQSGRVEHPLTFVKRHFLEWRQNNKEFAQAKRNATFHYGLPTEFFHLVLGETYGYGEGFWNEDTRTLDEAQHNNFDLICRKLRLNPGDKLIEVGPGWGYMSMLAAEKYGADVTGYGIVESQNDGMRMLITVRSSISFLAATCPALRRASAESILCQAPPFVGWRMSASPPIGRRAA